MILTEQQIDYIKKDISNRGVSLTDLADSLVDHICCFIENNNHTDFSTAYEAALAKFGSFGPKEIQKNTTLLLNLKKETIMKATMYILGYVAVILVTTGSLFKTMHWPMANIFLVTGIMLLNIGVLPMYFYNKYKQSIAQ